jgi:class 3 adenylate cyclase/tetratricopeptide (TPR) repeat protein
MERRCPSCGEVVPAGFRFCGSCGAPFDVASARARAGSPPPIGNLEERKVVTALFADLTASTEMASRLDPEDLRGVLRPFYDAMVEEIDRYGGTVEKFIGDAVVAVFGAPIAHEDDPERAVRCALAMHGRLAQLNDELADLAGAELRMRIGINTGDVLAHSVEEGIVTGEAVNIAARFQGLANPGRVVVGERTYRDTRHAFAFRDLGEVTVKGIDRPLAVFEVDAQIAPARAAGAALEAPFVGRGSEMELLRLLFARTIRDSTPNLVTIVGPPGIGKSRLSHEAALELGGVDGSRVARGRCLPYGDGLTYWPLAEILKADAGILDSDPAPAILQKARARLDPRFPGEEGMGITSVLLSSVGVEVPSDPLAGAEREAARRLIARAWQRYLESLAAEGPLIALIEDIHWADASLLDLIESVVSRASGPALVLCMARPDLFERRPDWGGGPANATTITLSPLSAREGTALIEHLLDDRAPAEVVGPVLHRSEGNPFFAGELLRMMMEDGTLARRDGRWVLERELPSDLPDTVQGVIASRIDMLSSAEKRAIQDASVIGRVFWQGGLERLGTPEPGTAIDGLLRTGFVWEREGSSIEGERELIFNHVLTRDVAYASIPRARRAEAHATVGAWMEEGTSGRHEEFAEILAYHFEAAGDSARTARFALLAGNRLQRVFAAERAIDWYDRAAEAAREGEPALRSEIAIARGGACELLGRFPEAREDYEHGLAFARGAADATLEARALVAIAHVSWLLDRYDEGDELLPLALDRAREVGAADLEARLLYTAGTIRFGRGAFDEALPFHEHALRVAESSGDLEGQALAHHGLCETYFFFGPLGEGLRHGLRADELLRALGQRSMVAHNAYMVAWLLGFEGRWDEAVETVNGSIATSGEIGNRREEAFALFDRAELFLSAGRLADAFADAQRGTEVFRELGVVRGTYVGLHVSTEVLAEAWGLDGMAGWADEALRLADDLGSRFMRPPLLAYAGWARLAAGDRAAAERCFAEARAQNDAFLQVAWSCRTEVLAHEWSGDAPGLADAAVRIERLVLPSNAFFGAWGPYARALADLLEGRHEEALAASTRALELAGSVSERRLAWRARRVAWRALDALGRLEEGELHRAEAAAMVDAEASAAGSLREAFVARPDVAELLA